MPHDLASPFIQVKAAAGGVRAEDADRREIRQHLIMLLGLPQRFVGQHEFGGALRHADGQFIARDAQTLRDPGGLGHVQARADVAGELPGGIEARSARIQNPAIFAVGAPHAVFRLEGCRAWQWRW